MWFSRYQLNTYRNTPYFEAHVPVDFPIDQLIQSVATFHELPPRLQRLAQLSRAWGRPRGYGQFGIDDYYDAEGFELDPDTGRRASREQVLDERGGDLVAAPIDDIPEPPGGFADPDSWQPAVVADDNDLVDRTGLTEAQLLSDIASRGRGATAAAYGLPATSLADFHSDRDLVAGILAMDGKPWSVVL